MVERNNKEKIEIAFVNWHADLIYNLAVNDLEIRGIKTTNEAIREYLEKEFQNSFHRNSMNQRAKRKKTSQINKRVNKITSTGESLREREKIAQEQILEGYKGEGTAFQLVGDIITKDRYVEES